MCGWRSSLAGCMLMSALSAQAVVNFNVSFDDPGSAHHLFYADITRNVQAAGADWVSRFQVNVNTTLDISIDFGAIGTATGASAAASFLGLSGGLNTYEQGAAAKLKTGLDVNGAAPDIRFTIGINGYLQNELWFDPNPQTQAAAVPSNKTDARSVFLHEFGHAFAFNGWRNGTNGALPGNYQSSFDALVRMDSASAGAPSLLFTGAQATALYGGHVPLTFGNYGHVGNSAPRPGADLVPDLMNGVVFFRGSRYQISALDLAIMQDVGLPVAVTAVPEPASVMLMLAGLALLQALRRRL
jgi:PEP-CTERM motif